MENERDNRKVVWVTSGELQRMHESAREHTHDCPHCHNETTYPLSNGEVFDLTTSCVIIECIKCQKSYHIAWEGDSYDMRDEDDLLPF